MALSKSRFGNIPSNRNYFYFQSRKLMWTFLRDLFACGKLLLNLGNAKGVLPGWMKFDKSLSVLPLMFSIFYFVLKIITIFKYSFHFMWYWSVACMQCRFYLHTWTYEIPLSWLVMKKWNLLSWPTYFYKAHLTVCAHIHGNDFFFVIACQPTGTSM